MSASNGISSAMKDFNADEFNLFPILPSTIRDSRCQAASCARGSSTIVPLANLVSVPSYQFQGWTISAHPEGNLYAHIKVSAGITMVTEARIAEPGVADQLNAWLSLICNTLTEKHVHLPETSHLFLEIHNHSGSCNYYFADHNLRTVFWLHTLDTVGVQPQHSVTINSHLQYALEENYWIHIGLFPDAASQYSVRALNDLKVVFLHARADADTPTFPYTTRQREEIIDLLEHNKNRTHNSYITTYVAGLWTTVASHRLTHFGEDHCRLSFCRSTLEIQDSTGKWGILLAIISNTLLFGFPDGYQARFKSLWVDQLVNTSRWREHTSGTVEDLRQTVSSMLALIM
ncbi:hypothetical protein EDB83DRAFT_1947158 [Lactarius deliciosus]|nr:hypothetical protein EDB83DRAFT_1947158 [Lactarius deliciosus]